MSEEALLDQVAAAYDGPTRGYHNVEHLEEVLGRIDEISAAEPAPVDREVLLLAAFFHDVVYRTQPGGAETNEEASARVALAALSPHPKRERVAELVRATTDHRAGAGDAEAAVLLDADLGILAAPADRYARYVAGVRKEYAWLPEPDFQRGRAAVLQDLLDRDWLFTTTYARAAWEDAARANLRGELSV